MKKIIIMLFLSFSISSQAGMLEDFKKSIRPYVVSILGEEKATILLGPGKNSIRLPKIPKVKKDAKNVGSIGSASRVDVNYKKEDLQKFNYSFVYDIFRAVRRLEPEDQDIAKWMNVLEQNGSREGVYRALVLDGMYLSLERHEFPITEDTVSFTVSYLEKYLDKSIEKEKLKKLNFFTVKRSVTERTLETLDELLKLKGDEVYDWYAILSAEFAKKYPKAMDNKIRKDTRPIVHKKWAKSVPDQYLKSEVIIKLHKIFNIVQG